MWTMSSSGGGAIAIDFSMRIPPVRFFCLGGFFRPCSLGAAGSFPFVETRTPSTVRSYSSDLVSDSPEATYSLTPSSIVRRFVPCFCHPPGPLAPTMRVTNTRSQVENMMFNLFEKLPCIVNGKSHEKGENFLEIRKTTPKPSLDHE